MTITLMQFFIYVFLTTAWSHTKTEDGSETRSRFVIVGVIYVILLYLTNQLS